jgi:hypothetical protein
MDLLKIPRRIFRLESLYLEGKILLFTDPHTRDTYNVQCNLKNRKKIYRVLSTDPLSGKVDVSLKKRIDSISEIPDGLSFSDLHVGDIVDGQVKRVESYGLFVTIQSSELVYVVITRLHNFFKLINMYVLM